VAALQATADLPIAERLAAQAMVLRRLARTIGGEKSVRLRGSDWLVELDRIFRTDYFTRGDGRCFGDDLYAVRGDSSLDITVRLERLVRRMRR
jgi:hypothetical protein